MAQQARQPSSILRRDARRGIQGEAAVFPREHLADIVVLDRPAASEPAQRPHAQLLGDGGGFLRGAGARRWPRIVVL
jgi:hypothetical protein